MGAVTSRFDWEVLSTALPGAGDPTDAHLVLETRAGITAVLIDGHGQGPSTLAAARRAFATIRAHLEDPPAAAFGRVHVRLADSPGVSMVLARVSPTLDRVEFSGVGRIHALLASTGGVMVLDSAPGVLGIGRPLAPRSAVLSWTADSTLVLAADGLVDRWDFGGVRGLAPAPATEVVGVLTRPFARMPDDVTLIVLRGR